MLKVLFSCALLLAFTLALARPSADQIHTEDVENASGKMKRGIWDGLFSIFDYEEEVDDYGDNDSDEKYLICKNCTVLLQPQAMQPAVQPPPPPPPPPAAPAPAPPAAPAPAPPAPPATAPEGPAPREAPAEAEPMESTIDDSGDDSM